MPTPRLIHPVPIVLEQVDRKVALERADAREPIQHAGRKTPVTLDGQVNWISEIGGGVTQEPDRTGMFEVVKGYVLFRYKDLDDANIMLAREDRLKKIGNREVDAYINRLQDTGHYADAGGATLVKAYFEGRAPAKKRNA